MTKAGDQEKKWYEARIKRATRLDRIASWLVRLAILGILIHQYYADEVAHILDRLK